jgi:DNA repair protein RecO (recombination protein O)
MSDRIRSIRTEGVILHRRDFGEKDRILTIFTRKMGRISVIAKGVRSPQSKKAGHLEPFMRSMLLIARGKNLHILTQAEVLETYGNLRENLVGIGYGSYVVELLDAFTYEEGAHLSLYNLIVATLKRLDRGDPPLIVLRHYDLRLLDEVGFRPELFRCVECGEEIQEVDQYLSGKLGGVVCPACRLKTHETEMRPVTSRVLKYLRHIQRTVYRDVKDIQVPRELVAAIDSALRYYLVYILEKNLNTPEFIERMQKLRFEQT